MRKQILSIFLLLFVLGSVGCSKNGTKESGDYTRCNESSQGNMAEIENGFFFKVDGYVYYADKTDINNWVAVCNNPNCPHGVGNAAASCNAAVGSAFLVQKNGKLYYYDEKRVWELEQDGSGSKVALELPIRNDTPIGMVTEDYLLYRESGLTEDGFRYHKILRFNEQQKDFDTIFYGLVQEDESQTGEDFITSDSEYAIFSWGISFTGRTIGIRGDSVLFTADNLNEWEGIKLWDVSGDYIERIDIPEDIPVANSYLSGEKLTYFEEKEGFYELDIATGEKICISENQLEHSKGYVLTEEYMVECTKDEEDSSETVDLKFYNGEKWLDVAVPDGVTNLSPVAVASDRIFFRQSMSKYYRYKLYQVMLKDKTPELEFCVELGEEPDFVKEEEQPSTSNIETITVFDNEDALFQVTDFRLDEDTFVFDVYWDIQDAERDHTIKSKIKINGIYCEASGWFDSRRVREDQRTEDEEANEEARHKELLVRNSSTQNDTSIVLDLYELEKLTEVELTFYMIEDETQEIIEEKTVAIYPKGEEQATNYVREQQSTDVVLLDNEEVTVMATDYGKNDLGQSVVTLYAYNKTEQDLRLCVDGLSINGVMTQSYGTTYIDEWYVCGNGATFHTILMNPSISDGSYIMDISEIGLAMHMYDVDYVTYTKIGDKFITCTGTLYPNGTSDGTKYTRIPEVTDQVVLDTENIKVTITGYEDVNYTIWSDEVDENGQQKFENYETVTIKNGAIKPLYVENKTDQILTVHMEVNKINGLKNDTSEKMILMPKASGYCTINCDLSELAKNNTTSVTQIEMQCKVEAYNGHIEGSVEEKIVLKP